MDSNNFRDTCGVGEREGRIRSISPEFQRLFRCDRSKGIPIEITFVIQSRFSALGSKKIVCLDCNPTGSDFQQHRAILKIRTGARDRAGLRPLVAKHKFPNQKAVAASFCFSSRATNCRKSGDIAAVQV